ncbi:MAG TPA: hypothetical protein VGF76_23055, partial [Polyangiaceae bacterium]
AQGAEVDHVSIRFCPLTGCANDADVRVLTADQAGQFAMSSKYLYWDEPDGANNFNRQIFRVAKPQP